MLITDLVALAKAGYTPAQVKEILKIQETVTDGKPEGPAETGPKEETQPEQANNEPEAAENGSGNKEAELNSTIEELKKELEKVKNDLAEAQQANIRRDNSGNEPKPDEQLQNIVRAFM